MHSAAAQGLQVCNNYYSYKPRIKVHAALVMAEESWLRRIPTIGLLSFFVLAAALSLAALAQHSPSSTPRESIAPPTASPAIPARVAILYTSGEKAAVQLPGATRLPVSTILASPSRLRGYSIAVITKGAAKLLSKHPDIIATMLREGVALLVQGPKPLHTLLAGMRPGPQLPLTLLPLTADNKPGLPVEAAAAAIIPVKTYRGGKIAPYYIVFHKATLAKAVTEVSSIIRQVKNGRLLPDSATRNDLEGAHDWYYVGQYWDHEYISAYGVAVGSVQYSIEFDYTPNYTSVRAPANGLWRIIIRDDECTSPGCLPDPDRVVDSFIPHYFPILGYCDPEANRLAVNVSYYIDQAIIDYWPDMDTVGPVSESLTPAIPPRQVSYTVTIPDSIVVKFGEKTDYSSYFKGLRINTVYWKWAYQSLFGESTHGSIDAVAYATAPLTAVGTRWPLAPPGLFVGIQLHSVAKASIEVPSSGGYLIVPGVVAKRDDMYRFYVTTTSVTLQGHSAASSP